MCFWHLRWSHIIQDRRQRLVQDKPLEKLRVDPLPICESGLEGKMTKIAFSSKGDCAKDVLELVHSDVCAPINEHLGMLEDMSTTPSS